MTSPGVALTKLTAAVASIELLAECLYGHCHYAKQARVRAKRFNRMLEDGKANKLNIIMTKSISRFGRDTVEILEALNQLKQLGVKR
ncbi:MAG: recombinase family protein [Streptococcus sp.]